MKKILIIIIFYASSTVAQKKNYISFGASFAHFDAIDGFEINASYFSQLNRYLGVEFKINYAKANDFPKVYRFSEHINQNYWYTKSTMFNISPLLHLIFINNQKHNFSFYGGLGLMFLDTADNTNTVFNPNEINFESSMESYNTISKTIGIKYVYYLKNYGFGLDAKLISPLNNDDKYFGQDNYRAIGLFITKKF